MNQSPIFKNLRVFLPFILTLPSLLFSQNYPTAWSSRGVGGGGAVFSPSISPYDGDHVFLACDMSLLHQSTDFGQSWSIIPFQQITAQRNTNVQFTADPLKLYALRLQPNTAGYEPYVSTDGGGAWTAANSPSATPAFQLFANPYDTEQFLLSNPNNIYFTDDESGDNFTLLQNTPGANGLHLAGAYFENSSTAYVCSNDQFTFTTNSGASWNAAPGGLNGIPADEEIAVFKGAKEDGQIVFFCTTIEEDPTLKLWKMGPENAADFKGFYKMRLGETQWTNLSAKLPTPGTDLVILIGVAPGDTSTIYLAGKTFVSGVTLGTVFRSADGGWHWTNVFLDAANFAGNTTITTGWLGKPSPANPNYKFKWNGINYIGGLAVDPNDAARIFISDGMTAYSSTNSGASWQQVFTDFNYDNPAGTLLLQSASYKTTGLETTASYWTSWVGGDTVLTGYNDILARRSLDGGVVWDFNMTGLDSQKINDVNMILEHPTNHRLYAAAGEIPGSNGDYTDARVLLVRGRISYSTDNGLNWQTLKSWGHAVSSIAFHPDDPNQMYATVIDVPSGIGGTYHCPNILTQPGTWNLLAEPPRTEGRPLKIVALGGNELVAVYGARDISTTGNPTFQYSNSSGIFYSDDNGASWQDRTDDNMEQSTIDIILDPNDASGQTWLAFVSLTGSLPEGVYRSTSAGAAGSWFRVYDQGVNSGTFHPTLSNEMYLCTERNGLLFATNTNGNSWATESIESYPFRQPWRVFFKPSDVNEVWVASFGNGFRVGYSSLLPLELLDFQGKCADGNVLLEWTTASEVNVAGFAVEKSGDGKDFGEVGWQAASGVSDYQFFDSGASSGAAVYYRLRMVDLDGKFSFSPVAALQSCLPDSPWLEVFPNPTNGELHLKMYPAASGEGIFQLWNSAGALVFEKETALETEPVFEVGGLPGGLYFYRFWSGQAWLGGRVVKL